ncbi:cell wall-binding repeat-containing protein [Alkalihalobacillus sp. CinArs1]|uniref:cell wall-binding repeat-containing protein n=1 Tax=Alkalihalobacillus sp. CinArs1 TaxID=2995314 RepID=UPI0022DD1502|nr:cell wall-binding repeat-containing protein [Alkalihalobacillus sp. CinArs1]
MKPAKVMAILLFSAFMFFMLNGNALAAPANDMFRTMKQPDGTTFLAKAVGDEFKHWMETKNGYVIVQGKDKYWYYSTIKDANVTITSSKVGIDSVPSNASDKKDMVDLPSKNKFESPSKSPESNNITLQSVESSSSHNLLVLLINFTDTKAQYSESQWNTQIFSKTVNSLNTYYNEISDGKFQFIPAQETSGSNNGVASVSLNYNHPDPVDRWNEGDLYRKIVADALKASDSSVNYSQYDKNNDGYISVDELHVVTIVAGGEGSYGDPSPRVWGHKWGLFSEAPMLDGVTVGSIYNGGGYTQFGEKHDDHMATIGIIAHELGHDLGLPDLYDRDGSSLGIGVHSLMASGSWAYQNGEYPGQTPTHMDAWSKQQLGYVVPNVISASTKTKMNSNKDGSYNVIRINTIDPSEYFLIENRQYTGYDRGLENVTVSGGVAIWHIDEDRSWEQNDNEFHKLVDLEEANEKYGSDLDTYRWYVDFNHYYRKGNEALFNTITTPNSKLYNGTSTKVAIQVNDYSQDVMGVSIDLGDGIDIDEPVWPAGSTLNATEVGTDSVKLSWSAASDNKGVSNYHIYEGNTLVKTVNGDVRSTVIDALTPNTSYTFRVEAADAQGNKSLNGPSLTVKTGTESDTKKPEWPANASLKASEVETNTLKLTWTPATDESGIAHYYIFQGAKLIKTLNGDVTNTTVTNLNANTSYTFTVQAADPETNTTTNGPSVTAKTLEEPDKKKPEWPANASVSATKINSDSVELSWSPATDESGIASYHIYVGNQIMKTVSGDVTTAQVSNLTPNKSYTFKVEAVDPKGNSSMNGPFVTVKTPLESVVRIKGQDRFGTANQISQNTYKSAVTVVIATGYDFPDALAGGPLAKKLQAPILLAGKTSLSEDTINEIKRLKASKAVILGGTGAVSDSVRTQLEKLGLSVERISGKDRFETAAKIAEKMGLYDRAVIAYGMNFPDALAIAPFAAQNGYPILLTKTKELPDVTKNAIKGVTKTYVIGGTGVISENVSKSLPSPTRYAGKNRFATNAAIVSKLYSNYDTVYYASGMNFPDALTGSVAAAQNAAPKFLVMKDKIPAEIMTLINERKAKSYVILGGSGAIDEDVEKLLSE